jgi:O-antigen ligase
VNYADILSSLNKDPTLTGRVPLWGLLMELAVKHGFLGYGLGAFWLMGNDDVQWVWAVAEWQSPEAHNGYIDILLQLGLPGLVLAIWSLCEVIGRSFVNYRQRRYSWSSFAFVYSVTFLLTNMVSTLLYHVPDIHSVILPACYLACRMTAVDRAALMIRSRVISRRVKFYRESTDVGTSPDYASGLAGVA